MTIELRLSVSDLNRAIEDFLYRQGFKAKHIQYSLRPPLSDSAEKEAQPEVLVIVEKTKESCL